MDFKIADYDRIVMNDMIHPRFSINKPSIAPIGKDGDHILYQYNGKNAIGMLSKNGIFITGEFTIRELVSTGILDENKIFNKIFIMSGDNKEDSKEE